MNDWITEHRIAAIVILMIIGIGLIVWANTGFSLQISKFFAASNPIDPGGGGGGQQSTSTPTGTTAGPGGSTPNPSYPTGFPNCFVWNANNSDYSNWSDLNALGNPTNIVTKHGGLVSTVSAKGMVVYNNCPWTVHLGLIVKGSKKAGGDPISDAEAVDAEPAFNRKLPGGAQDFPPCNSLPDQCPAGSGPLCGVADPPKCKGPYEIVYDINRYTCGRVQANAFWRHYKSGNGGGASGGNADYGGFAVVFNYGRDCTGSVVERAPGNPLPSIPPGGGTPLPTVTATAFPTATATATATPVSGTATPTATVIVMTTPLIFPPNGDADSDGIPNIIECPAIATSSDINQCPDADHNGVPDIIQAAGAYVPVTPIPPIIRQTGTVATVQTGPGDAVLLALLISAVVSLGYVAYTYSPGGRRQDARAVSKNHEPMDFRS